MNESKSPRCGYGFVDITRFLFSRIEEFRQLERERGAQRRGRGNFNYLTF